MPNTLPLINWKQILVFTVATWFIMYAFYMCSLLLNIEALTVMHDASIGKQSLTDAMGTGTISTGNLITYLFWTSYSSIAGILMACIITLLISK